MPESRPSVATSSKQLRTSAGAVPGLRARHSADTPATCGEAIDVPDRVLLPPPRAAETMSRPGANTSTQRPWLEKKALPSLRLVAPVPRAWATRAGEESQASSLSLPAATA